MTPARETHFRYLSAIPKTFIGRFYTGMRRIVLLPVNIGRLIAPVDKAGHGPQVGGGVAKPSHCLLIGPGRNRPEATGQFICELTTQKTSAASRLARAPVSMDSEPG
ncbi:MAG: hypothetical protein ABJC09_03805 [Terriglobia bacterium]